ncbi:hypothetical protein ACTI_32550 [Actinoplanes sp. OR16]|nr:hypothetical protein ACTI_32550 [Actinoplanes sp. OR16]
MRKKPIVGGVALLALLGALGVFVVLRSVVSNIKLPQLGPECTVSADGKVTLDSQQMANAATITAVGVRRGFPEQAVVVALATAFQESKLENLDDGDRDSVGLFQQRPSQGWGTFEQIKDPRYAAGKFYSALKKVKGWQEMRVTDAAQKVQRSAYPEAYEKWADESKVLAAALTGRATGAVECRYTGTPVIRGAEAATALLASLKLDWGKKLPNKAAATGTAGLTVDVPSADSGWRYAHWLVSHAAVSGLERVRFADLEWHAPEGKWQPVTDGGDTTTARVVAEVFR